MGLKLKLLILVGLLGIAGVFAIPAKDACAGAGVIAEQTCDTQVWKSMEMRSRIETEREIMQNQNLIFKADSVLAYTCFDDFAAHAAKNVGSLFTHTQYFAGRLIIQWGDQDPGMDSALNKTVVAAMKTYLNSNFQHSYLGGRGEKVGLPSLSNTMQETENIPSQGKDYACGTMAKVWAAAKCMNFIHSNDFKDTDGFHPYINLKGIKGKDNVSGYETIKDTRNFPTPCQAANPVVGKTWPEAYRESRNETGFGAVDANYDYGDPLNKAFKKVRELIEPGRCVNAPISTGVKVILNPASTASESYLDGVCTNPGCTFKKGSGSSPGECVARAGSREGGPD